MNDFDELIDADVEGSERERLRSVHELLLQAGPPPELSAALSVAPRPGEVRFLKRQTVPRKVALLAAAVAVLGVTFTFGFAVGNHKTVAAKPLERLGLRGTAAAPRARATIDISQEVSGNYPMTLSVRGLPRVAAPQYYYVWLVRHGKPWAPCGEFVVSKPSHSLTLALTAPYSLKRGDTWVVTRKSFTQTGAGQVVLRPVFIQTT